MNKIYVNKRDIPNYLLPVVKGDTARGFFLPDNPFYQLLLNPDRRIKEPEKVNQPDLFSYQNVCLSQMFAQKKLLISLSPGMGKTVVVSKYLQLQNFRNVLIVAPKALHYIWVEHIEKYVGITPTIRPEEYIGGYVLANIQHLHKIDFMDRIDCLIVDETILLKNRKTHSFRSIESLIDMCNNVYFLSGSPYSKNISDMWSQLNLLYPQVFSSYWDFTKIFCEVKIDRYGWHVNGYPQGSKAQEEREDLLKKVLRPFVFFAHIDDHANLPEYIETEIRIEPSIQQVKIELAFNKHLKYQHIEIDGTLALLTRLKQLSLYPPLLDLDLKSPKIETLKEMLEIVEYPCIVCSTSNVVLKWLYEQYSNSALFTAESEGFKDYLSGDKDLMFMQLMSGKFGHSFTNTRTLIYLDYTFNSDDLYQSLARVKRVTSKLPVSIYHLLSSRIDYIMYDLCKSRNISIENVLKEYNNNG